MNSTFLDTFFWKPGKMNAGIVLGVSQTPECMAYAILPSDLIQGHRGPEFETLGVWLKQLQLIWDEGSSLSVLWKSSPRLGVQKSELSLPLSMVLRALNIHLRYRSPPQCRVVFIFFPLLCPLPSSLCLRSEGSGWGFQSCSPVLDGAFRHPTVF